MDNYLITGYWGQPHVTAENDRGINAGIIGSGRFVLPVGEQFKAEYIGNNTIRMYDGKLVDNGAAAGIPAGEYIDLLIQNASDGMKRNDIIVFQYSLDVSTMIESGQFVVVQGEETNGEVEDPFLVQSDLLSNKATMDQMPLWLVSVSGATIAAPLPLFTVSKSLSNVSASGGGSSGNPESGSGSGTEMPDILPVSRGGTGADNAAMARTILGAAAELHGHAISDINGLGTLLGASAKITYGSYTGDGKKERTLSFEFEPKLVIVTSSFWDETNRYDDGEDFNFALAVFIRGVNLTHILYGATAFAHSGAKVTWGADNSVHWVSNGSLDHAAANWEARKYVYVAIG